MLINFSAIIRNTLKNKGITILNIVGLVAGFVCSILIVSWVIHQSTFDSFVKDKSNVYRVHLEGFVNGEDVKSSGCVPGIATFATSLPEVDVAIRMRVQSNTVINTTDDKFFRVDGFAVDSAFLDIFPFKVIAGDGKQALKTKNSILIDKKLANQCFGQEMPVGKNLAINGQKYTVAAVIENVATNSHLQFRYLVPTLNLGTDWQRNQWGADNGIVYLRLNTKSNIKALNEKITETFYNRSPFFKDLKVHTSLQPIKDIPFSNEFKHDYAKKTSKRNIYILSIVAFFILFIACINFTNLFISTAIKRKKAVGIKITSGASKVSIVWEYLGEVLAYILLSFFIALVLIKIIHPYFNQLSGVNIEIKYFSFHFLSLALSLIILIIAITGIFPGIYLTRLNISEVMKGSKTGPSNSSVQKVLVTSQFVLATLLLFAVITIIKQVNFLHAKNLGFDKENVLYVYTEGELRFPKGQQKLKNELLQNPSIKKIAYRSCIPTEFNTGTMVSLTPESKEYQVHMEYVFVDSDYFDLANIDFVEGNNIFSNAHDSLNYCIINKKAAEALNLSAPYEDKVVYSSNGGGKAFIIKGVIKDVNTKSLTQVVYPCIYVKPEWYNRSSILLFKLQGDPAQAISTIKKYWDRELPESPFEYHFLDDTYNALYKSEEKAKTIISWFTAIALILTTLGLLAMVHFMTENRVKEIGVRKVNGAKVSEVLVMLNKNFIKWVFIAFVIATPIAWYAMNKWLENFAYKTAISWWIFALTGSIAFGIALITVSWQSWKAATRNPVEALRYE